MATRGLAIGQGLKVLFRCVPVLKSLLTLLAVSLYQLYTQARAPTTLPDTDMAQTISGHSAQEKNNFTPPSDLVHRGVQEQADGRGRTGPRCLLCMDTMSAPTAAPCGHVFCWTCIGSWTRAGSRGGGDHCLCPVCRRPFTPPDLRPLFGYV